MENFSLVSDFESIRPLWTDDEEPFGDVGFPRIKSLTSSDRREFIPIESVVGDLGVSSKTLKRLLTNAVVPHHFARKSKGGHWWIRSDASSRDQIKDEIALWRLSSRKPGCARHTDRQSESSSIHLHLLEHRFGRQIDDLPSYRALVSECLEDLGSGGETRPQHPLHTIRAEQLAIAKLQIAIKRWLEHRKGHLSGNPELSLRPTVRDIAEVMQTSVASLYRKPYGREALRLALGGSGIR